MEKAPAFDPLPEITEDAYKGSPLSLVSQQSTFVYNQIDASIKDV